MYYTQLRSDSNSAQYDNGEWGRGKSETYYIHSGKDNAWGKKHFNMLNVHVYYSGNDEKENKNAKPSKVIIKTMKLKSEIAALVLLVWWNAIIMWGSV